MTRPTLFVAVISFLLSLTLVPTLGNPSTIHLNVLNNAVLLSADPTTITNQAQEVRIRWSGNLNPSNEDWFGIYCPSSSELSKPAAWDPTRIMAMTYANQSETWQQGFGDVKLKMLNMRDPYHVVMFRGQLPYFVENDWNIEFGFMPGNAIELGSVKVDVNAMYPMQIHIALTHNPTEMRVMWTSGSTKVPTVHFGKSKGSLINLAHGDSHTYTKDDLMFCARDGHSRAIKFFREPGQLHDVLLQNLLPNTTYYYKVGTDDAITDEIFSFTTAPLPAKTSPIKLIAFGDSGVSECHNTPGWCETDSGSVVDVILEEMNHEAYTALLHIGDLSYAVGHSERWEQFFSQIQPITSRLPYMVSLGNHEYDYYKQPFRPAWSNYGNDSHGECGVPTSNRFSMPHPWNQLDRNEEPIFWYSYNLGCVHIATINLETDFSIGSEQQDWLINDLRQVNREVTPWVIVAGHRPMYNSGNFSDDYEMSLHIQSEMDDVFMRFGVDLAIWGHYHSYERTCPVYKQQCRKKAPVHVTIGMAGADLDTAGWMEPIPEWSVFRDEYHYGYSRIYVDERSLHMQFVSNANKVLDDFTLHRTEA